MRRLRHLVKCLRVLRGDDLGGVMWGAGVSDMGDVLVACTCVVVGAPFSGFSFVVDRFFGWPELLINRTFRSCL